MIDFSCNDLKVYRKRKFLEPPTTEIQMYGNHLKIVKFADYVIKEKVQVNKEEYYMPS